MQTLMKDIRGWLGMSQMEFAEQLNVRFATVNRWENGHAVPNKLAQDRICELCKERNVPVYEMTLKRIAAAAEMVQLEAGRVLLYHGSKAGIVGVIEPKSRKQCDFVQVFYMGTEPSQALTLIAPSGLR